MKIQINELQKMYDTAGIDKNRLYKALLEWGNKGINGGKYKKEWSIDNPTKNYCYVVSEMVYNYFKTEGAIPMIVKVDGYDITHRYLLYPNNQIVDLTAEQFPDYEKVDYSKGKKCNFLPTPNGISLRAQKLYELYTK